MMSTFYDYRAKFYSMSYKEFCDYCNARACDGQWPILEAIACLGIIDYIESTKVKGFLMRRKRLHEAKELVWKRLLNEDPTHL